ncbi:MAG: sensor histidine kinase, partial [Longimicrobiales bacterium]
VLERLVQRPPLRLESRTPQADAVRSGETRLISFADDAWLERVSDDADHFAVLSNLRPRTLIVAPLRARASVIGAITIGRFAAEPAFTEEDRAFADELGRRAGMAVENARLYRELAAASEAKSRFLSTMSHELRTPLNAIIGYASLLRDGVSGPLPPAQREHVSRILTASDHLLLLINEVLALSRIEAGKEEVDHARCDGAQMARDVAELVAPIARQKGLRLDVDAPASLPLRTDETKVRQVLLNLLSNACKFNDHGSVTLSVQASDRYATFRVSDTGPGIPPEELDRIFEPFYQVSQGTTRAADGTGLGLTVSRRLAHLLGGDLNVESTPGEGSTFTLTLPLDRADPTPGDGRNT